MSKTIDKIRNIIKNTSRGRRFAWGVWVVSFIIGIFVLYPYVGVFSESRFSILDFDDGHNLEAIRNIILIIAAFLAFPLAIHRTVIANEHAETAQKQLKKSEEQLVQAEQATWQAREEAKRQRLEDGFERWQRDLFSGKKSQQYSAINQLWKLAQNHARDYHIRIMDSLSDFLEETKTIDLGADAAILALKILTNQDDRHKKTPGQEYEEIINDYCIRLQYLNIKDIDLSIADFSRSILKDIFFENVILKEASFKFSDLSGVHFGKCNLISAKFSRCLFVNNTTFTATTFTGSDLTGAFFNEAFLKDVNFANARTIIRSVWTNISLFDVQKIHFFDGNHKKHVMKKEDAKSENKWKTERQAELDKIKRSKHSPDTLF